MEEVLLTFTLRSVVSKLWKIVASEAISVVLNSGVNCSSPMSTSDSFKLTSLLSELPWNSEIFKRFYFTKHFKRQIFDDNAVSQISHPNCIV